MRKGVVSNVSYLPRLSCDWGIRELKLLTSAGVIPEIVHDCRGVRFEGPVTAHHGFKLFGYLAVAVRDSSNWYQVLLIKAPCGLFVAYPSLLQPYVE